MHKMKRLIWKDIELINQLAEKHGYNRQVDISALKKDVKKNVKSMGYKDFYQVYFAAKEHMVHEHKDGKKCEPHVRIGVWFPGGLEKTAPESSAIARSSIHVTLDCDLHLWNSLETLPSSAEQSNLIPQFTRDNQLAMVT